MASLGRSCLVERFFRTVFSIFRVSNATVVSVGGKNR